MHRRISPALPAIRVAFAPGGVPVVNSHVRLLHLHFLHFITPTNKPCQSLLHHTLLALTMLHQQVSKCTGSRAQSESCCRVSSALNLCYLQTASRTCINPTQTHKTTSFFFNTVCVFFKHSRHVGAFGLRFRTWRPWIPLTNARYQAGASVHK